jgi:hypothetical protein
VNSPTHGVIYSKNLGAIIGGAVGGLIVLAAVVTMHLHHRRSQREREIAVPVPESKHDSSKMDMILSPKIYKVNKSISSLILIFFKTIAEYHAVFK